MERKIEVGDTVRLTASARECYDLEYYQGPGMVLNTHVGGGDGKPYVTVRWEPGVNRGMQQTFFHAEELELCEPEKAGGVPSPGIVSDGKGGATQNVKTGGGAINPDLHCPECRCYMRCEAHGRGCSKWTPYEPLTCRRPEPGILSDRPDARAHAAWWDRFSRGLSC